VPIRRCTAKVPKCPVAGPCAPAQLGVAVCPCAGGIPREAYAAIVDRLVRGLTGDPSILLEPLRARIASLAAAERYEEAADMRDRAAALSRALTRQRQFDALRRAGRVEIEVAAEAGAGVRRLVFAGGRLVTEAGGGQLSLVDVDPDGEDPGPDRPLPRHLVDELSCVVSWLEAEARSVRLLHCEEPWSVPVQRLPRFEPVKVRSRAG
jgi:DNA polymerase-3 subunit epsilon